jgi:hypothetical protein
MNGPMTITAPVHFARRGAVVAVPLVGPRYLREHLARRITAAHGLGVLRHLAQSHEEPPSAPEEDMAEPPDRPRGLDKLGKRL